MCLISSNLKLCTCKTKNVQQLKNYWVLQRPTDETISVIGEMILPVDIGEQADKLNQKTILKQLNNANCFDVEMLHQENDILTLTFSYTPPEELNNQLPFNGDYLSYSFQFKKGKWKPSTYSHFDEPYPNIQQGKIVNPF